MTTILTSDERLYYQRQIVLPGWGEAGQERLKAASVLVVGAGGLGSPVLHYLGNAGIGRLGIADYDFVEISNLHRQIIHHSDDIGRLKTESAALTLKASNPHIDIVQHVMPVNADNALGLVGAYDLIADCSDNFATRDALNTACLKAEKSLISGAAQLTDGTLTTFKAHLGPPHPCFRCLYPDTPPAGTTPSCGETGTLGPVLAVIGGLQAMEVIKEIIGGGSEDLSGKVMMYQGWQADIATMAFKRREGCPACGQNR